MRPLARLIRYSLRQRLMLLLICVLTVVTSAVTALEPWPLKILVDHAPGDIRIPDLLNREAQTRLLSFVHQTLTVIPIIQAFGTEESNKQQFRRLSADAVERAAKVWLKN
jgi:hypothetical protein